MHWTRIETNAKPDPDDCVLVLLQPGDRYVVACWNPEQNQFVRQRADYKPGRAVNGAVAWAYVTGPCGMIIDPVIAVGYD